MGSDVEAIDLITEDEKRYHFSVKSLLISITIKDDITHSVFTYHHDEKGLTTNIHHHVIGPQTNEVPTEVDELIRKNFDYVNNNFDDLVLEFGNPYGIDLNNVTALILVDYLLSIGFIIES